MERLTDRLTPGGTPLPGPGGGNPVADGGSGRFQSRARFQRAASRWKRELLYPQCSRKSQDRARRANLREVPGGIAYRQSRLGGNHDDQCSAIGRGFLFRVGGIGKNINYERAAVRSLAPGRITPRANAELYRRRPGPLDGERILFRDGRRVRLPYKRRPNPGGFGRLLKGELHNYGSVVQDSCVKQVKLKPRVLSSSPPVGRLAQIHDQRAFVVQMHCAERLNGNIDSNGFRIGSLVRPQSHREHCNQKKACQERDATPMDTVGFHCVDYVTDGEAGKGSTCLNTSPEVPGFRRVRL